MAACGSFHTLVVTESGELYAWGTGLDFQLGLSDDDNRRVPALVEPASFENARVLMAAGGGAFSAVVTEDGLYTFGEGGPWLGLAHETPDFSAPQKHPSRVSADLFNYDKVAMTSCGTLHQAAITDTGDVYCWGQGGPRLGLGDAESRAVPIKVPRDHFADSKVVLISCGAVHTAAVTDAGGLYTWGFGGEGRLGHGDTAMRLTPTLVAAIGQRFGTGPLRARVMTVSGGGFHTAAITEDGDLWTWGQGRDGALGHGDRQSKLLPTKVASPLVCGDSAWAANVDCASSHTAAVAENGDIYTWGKGENGCLGHGDDDDRLSPTLNAHLRKCGAKVLHAACGHSHVVCVTHDGCVWSWGYGKTGALGSDSMRHSLVPVPLETHSFGAKKAARVSRVPVLLALAFASVTHARLGEDSEFAGLLLELVERIIKVAWRPAWPAALLPQAEGIARLLGGV